MKWLIAILLLSTIPVFAQQGIIGHNSITVTLDSTDTESVYWAFDGRWLTGGGFSSTALDPPDEVQTDRNVAFYGFITTTSTSSEYDSLSIYSIPLTHNGYLLPDTIFWDYTNNDTASTQQWTSWTSFSGAVGTGIVTFFVDLTSQIKNFFGLKIDIVQAAADSNGTGNGIVSSLVLHSAESK